MTDQEALLKLLDQLPIYAVKIGYRGGEHEDGESTEAERAFADALFDIHTKWLELKATLAVAS